MNKRLIAGNWKMNLSKDEIKTFLQTTNGVKLENKALICVPFVYIDYAQSLNENPQIVIGAQNVAAESQGAYTGEVSAAMLQDMNVHYVIVGHSERREFYAESDDEINKKIRRLVDNNMAPILCVGEILDERKAKMTNSVITSQLKNALKDFTEEELKQLVIAYEPVWAIGSGESATAEDANSVCMMIRELMLNMYGKDFSDYLKILYGGSVNRSNVDEYMNMTHINGALVGGASIDPEHFLDLLK